MIHLIIFIVLILLAAFLPKSMETAWWICNIGYIIVGILGVVRIIDSIHNKQHLSSWVYCKGCGQRLGTVRDHPTECPRCGSNRISSQDPFQ